MAENLDELRAELRASIEANEAARELFDAAIVELAALREMIELTIPAGRRRLAERLAGRAGGAPPPMRPSPETPAPGNNPN